MDIAENRHGHTYRLHIGLVRTAGPHQIVDGMLDDPHARQHQHQGNGCFPAKLPEEQEHQNQQWNRIQDAIVAHQRNGNQHQNKYCQIPFFLKPLSIRLPNVDKIYGKQHHEHRQRAVLPHKKQNPVGLRIGRQEKLCEHQCPYRKTPFCHGVYKVTADQAV